MATKKSVAMTPTKAPSNGVNCTSTAVEEAARREGERSKQCKIRNQKWVKTFDAVLGQFR